MILEMVYSKAVNKLKAYPKIKNPHKRKVAGGYRIQIRKQEPSYSGNGSRHIVLIRRFEVYQQVKQPGRL